MAAKKLTARLVATVTTKLEREDFRDATVRGLQPPSDNREASSVPSAAR